MVVTTLPPKLGYLFDSPCIFLFYAPTQKQTHTTNSNNSATKKQHSGASNDAAATPLSSSIEQQLKTIKVLKVCLQGKSSQPKKVSFDDKQNKNSISADNSQDQGKSKQSKNVSFDLTRNSKRNSQRFATTSIS